ncbi:MAG: plasmid pRiA4b ORF-3 family protein [Candidatus Thermoplasmatota archaeon]|nr:plasmid pRiA4b ORF-3 family protein [Candidatus Thermoplasmatota archaeon]
MKKKFDKVYQFKITLRESKPPIWRRIQVPETYTFWDLHVAIQDSMGWSDYHLHEFEIMNPTTKRKVRMGIPEGDFDQEVLPGWNHKIADYFFMENKKSDYIYDFGDDWNHIIKLEKVLPCDKNTNYPICIKGKRACPPEDVGGVYVYENFLEIIRNPRHPEHKSMKEWAGGEFDSEYFNMEAVHFDDPDKRWKGTFN